MTDSNESFSVGGHVAMLGAGTMWGLMAPVAKTVMAAGVVSPLLLTNLRAVGAAILFWVASLMLPREHGPPRDLVKMAGAAMLAIVFNQGSYVFGVGLTSPGEASVITTTMPLWVMIFAAVILREAVTWRKLGGILLGAAGALLLILTGARAGLPGDNPVLGDLLVLTAQMSFALYLTFYGRFIRRYSIFTLMKWMFTFASVPLVLVALPQWASLPHAAVTGHEIAGAAYVVFGGTFLAYICMMYGQKRLSPTTVGIYNYVQPIVATCVGIYLGLDTITPLKLLAIALIFTGVGLVITTRHTTPAKSPA